MRSTGVSRSIDSLGRVVIPKEIRKKMRIREADLLEFYTGEEGEIVLKKYSPMGELTDIAKQYAESLAQVSGHVAVITDRDRIIAVAGGCKEMLEEHVSKELQKAMDLRKTVVAVRESREFIPVSIVECDALQQGIVPILSHGDVIGSVILLARERRGQIGEAEKKLLQSAAAFLGRQMELG